jgi:hypothetical protein
MRATFITTGLQKGAQIEEYKKPPGTAIQAQPRFTIARIQPRKASSFLPRTDDKMFNHEENHRLLCMAERHPGEI